MTASANDAFFQLLWQPGQRMHDDWWPHLDLNGWQAKYPQLSPGARRELDRLICRRRGFPQGDLQAMFSERSALQLALLRAGERMPMLLLALGLLLLECPDYLLWRPYRERLAPWLNEMQRGQLQVLWRNGQRSPQLPPERLVYEAQRKAQAALDLALRTDPVWQALRYTLPVVEAQYSDPSLTSSIGPLFIRLERFL